MHWQEAIMTSRRIQFLGSYNYRGKERVENEVGSLFLRACHYISSSNSSRCIPQQHLWWVTPVRNSLWPLSSLMRSFLCLPSTTMWILWRTPPPPPCMLTSYHNWSMPCFLAFFTRSFLYLYNSCYFWWYPHWFLLSYSIATGTFFSSLALLFLYGAWCSPWHTPLVSRI